MAFTRIQGATKGENVRRVSSCQDSSRYVRVRVENASTFLEKEKKGRKREREEKEREKRNEATCCSAEQLRTMIL